MRMSLHFGMEKLEKVLHHQHHVEERAKRDHETFIRQCYHSRAFKFSGTYSTTSLSIPIGIAMCTPVILHLLASANCIVFFH